MHSDQIVLEVGCTRCERYGRLRVDRLIQRYGRGAKLPDLRDKLASDCPRIGATSIYDRCGVRYPLDMPGHSVGVLPVRERGDDGRPDG
jgi:hypothetical protein